MTTNTFAYGASPSQKYAGFGGYIGKMVAPASSISAFLFGLPGEGKSALLQSNPDAVIFNMDLASTSALDPVAVLFPGIDSSNGMPLGDNNQPIVLSMDLINQKVAILKELARTNQPRPRTIVFDSLSAWIRLLRDWIPRNAVGLILAKENKTDWKQLDGQAAWDLLYDMIVNTVTDLRAFGYGVYVVGHLVKTKVPVGEGLFSQSFELSITDSFWKRLFPLFELLGCITTVPVEVMVEKEIKSIIRGQEKIEIKRVPETVRKHIMLPERIDLAGITKKRVRLPSIELPERGAWAHFAAVYEEAIRKESPAPKGTSA